MRQTSLLALASLLACAACGGGSSSPTASNNNGTNTTTTNTDTFGGSATATLVDVSMPGTSFNPNHIDIAQGGTVRFTFTDVAHDVRFNNAAGAPSDILATSNATVTRVFANKGTFNFLCTIHANMNGVVTVH